MHKIIPAAAILLALAGCSTSQVSLGQAKPVPADRVYAYKMRVAGSGMITVVRDEGHTGSLCAIGLFIDGKIAARVETGEKVGLYVPAGQVVIGAAYQGSGICGMGAERRERDITVSAGQDKIYRIATGADGVIDVLPTTIR